MTLGLFTRGVLGAKHSSSAKTFRSLTTLRNCSAGVSQQSGVFGRTNTEGKPGFSNGNIGLLTLVNQVGLGGTQQMRFKGASLKKFQRAHLKLKKKNHGVQVVLLADLPKKNKVAGQLVWVKPGFMRHVLYPQGRALYATPDNIDRYAMDETAGVVANYSSTAYLEQTMRMLERRPLHMVVPPAALKESMFSFTAADFVRELQAQFRMYVPDHFVHFDQVRVKDLATKATEARMGGTTVAAGRGQKVKAASRSVDAAAESSKTIMNLSQTGITEKGEYEVKLTVGHDEEKNETLSMWMGVKIEVSKPWRPWHIKWHMRDQRTKSRRVQEEADRLQAAGVNA
eukprot:Clim_evm3s214 gene=Clim_evmTU3s214